MLQLIGTASICIIWILSLILFIHCLISMYFQYRYTKSVRTQILCILHKYPEEICVADIAEASQQTLGFEMIKFSLHRLGKEQLVSSVREDNFLGHDLCLAPRRIFWLSDEGQEIAGQMFDQKQEV